MARTTTLRYVWVLVFAVVVSLPSVALSQEASPVMELAPGVEVVANGLTNPRGFTWGADGTLYLALAGAGGDTQLQVEGTPVPYMVGPTSSVATVTDGCTSPVAEGLGSALWTDAGWIWGAMDVAILGEDLYVLLGAGSDLGGNGIYRVLQDGSIELVVDLGAWLTENPPAFIPPDYDPTGSWFDLESDGEKLWVSEAVGGYLLTVSTAGEVTVMADLSVGHLVPTGVALDGEGGAYVGFETTIPYPDGGSKVVHVAADGTVTDYWTGLTAVTDVVMGPDGMLYAAEMATGNTEDPPFFTPNSGRIVRMTGPDSLEEVVTDFEAPVYLGFGMDGMLYVTAPAYAPDAGEGHGALVQFDLGMELPLSAAGFANADPTCAGSATPVA
ncbi:MAG TPA: ScyD/ScyE family protein [Thermomicrobiales bacterium]|nr:ScyD/ScyE family protein [Thermomicrobiales bacterium]